MGWRAIDEPESNDPRDKIYQKESECYVLVTNWVGEALEELSLDEERLDRIINSREQVKAGFRSILRTFS